MQKILADCMHTWANVIILYLTAAEINTYCSHEAYLTFSFPFLFPFPSLALPFLSFEDAGRIYSFHSQFSVFRLYGDALLAVHCCQWQILSTLAPADWRCQLTFAACCLLPLPAVRCMLPLPLCCLLADDALSMTAASPAPPPHAHRQMDSWGNQQQQIISTVLGSLHCSKKRKTFRFQLQQANTCCKNRNFRWGARWHMGHAQETIEVLQVQVAAKQVS